MKKLSYVTLEDLLLTIGEQKLKEVNTQNDSCCLWGFAFTKSFGYVRAYCMERLTKRFLNYVHKDISTSSILSSLSCKYRAKLNNS